MRKSGWMPVMQGLSYLTQVGLSIATPVILMMLLASWLTQRVGLGAWVYVPALVLGLGAGACSFAGFAKYVTRKTVARAQRQAGEPQPVYVPNVDNLSLNTGKTGAARQIKQDKQGAQDKTQEKKR